MKQETQDEQPKSREKTSKKEKAAIPKEIGGYADAGKPEPTRYGDWEVGGRCSDF